MGLYTHWRDRQEASSDFINEFPYELSLGVNSSAMEPSRKVILVTKAFDEVYHRLLRPREFDEWDRHKGVVITGQPGVGASP